MRRDGHARHLATPSILLGALLASACPFGARPCDAAENKGSSGSSYSSTWDTSTGLSAPLYRTLSGTILHQAQVTTTWLLYPGACNDRAGGTWSPKTSPVADSLNSYSTSVPDHGYTIEDRSLQQIVWHITDGSDSPDVGSGLILSGARSLWCGRYDPSWVIRSGYPNYAYQILYLDTGTHTSSYTLSFLQNVSTEPFYDYLYLIGGGSGAADPIGNSRVVLDAVIADGVSGDSELLLSMTGSQISAHSLGYAGGGQTIVGAASGPPTTATVSLSGIPSGHRALYFVLVADPGLSNQDGLWPFGHGALLDNLSTSDNGGIYTDEAAAGGTDAFGGNVLKGTPDAPVISARVAPGVGTLWHIQNGSVLPTADYCAPQKQLFSDHMFEGSDATSHLTLAGSFAAVRTCTVPIPAGAGSVQAVWGEYLDLTRSSGFVQFTEFRCFKSGAWSDWIMTTPGRSEIVATLQAWTVNAAQLAEAAQADSVQLRLNLECIPYRSADHLNCQPATYGIIYDDLQLKVTTGAPAPIFRIYPGAVAQSTFVDGTDGASVGCSPGTIAAHRCWPGVRGSDQPASAGPIHDNFNAPLGDSITVTIATGLRRNGMGVNWRYGFDRTVGGGLVIARQNGAYNAAYDVPRVIFRLFDPSTKSWSAWDSSALDANAVLPAGADTFVIDSDFRMNWPPRDKFYVNQGGADIGPNADANLPGGFTLNGNTKYSQVPFLPKGTRVQYYFKAVDITGGTTYQWGAENQAFEVEDIPVLPGSANRAPDILEFDVLPRVYPAGAVGTLLAGRNDAVVLNLDGAYTMWGAQLDPVTQALRGMGVRADRYRFLQGLGNGNNIGGHELSGQRVDRLANYFPNMNEYAIKDSLASHYRIIIQSSHLRSWTVFEEQDAALIRQWWLTDTGTNSGDRCIFGSGDDLFNALLNSSTSLPQYAEQQSLAQNVFGVASAIAAWTNAAAMRYPTIDDRFAGGGPGLAAPGTYTYPLDGGCPGPNRFDGLTKIGSVDAQNSAFYPGGVTEVAGVARSSEFDPGPADNDRNKALGYGFSIHFIRTAGIPTTATNYVHSGVENRMRVLYKFLTSCRASMSGKTPCWPCPGNAADLTANWAAAGGFLTGTYGSLYPIQDYTQATGVPVEGAGAPRYVNALSQNRPNPFNPETVIPYSLSADGRVTIRIYDVAGRLVRTLVDKRETAGPHVARWDGTSEHGGPLASGVYFYSIRYPDGAVSARKMTILR